jgi:hypothetical protein
MVFDESNPMKLALQHVRTAPVPPSARTTLTIPGALERIVLQCLAKAPGNRPVSAAALAAMLSASMEERWTDGDAETWWDLHLPQTSSLRTFNQTPANTPAILRKQDLNG